MKNTKVAGSAQWDQLISVAFIDYKKAFDSMQHDYLLEILRIYEIDAATKLVLNGTVSKLIPIKFGTDKFKIIHLIRGQLDETEEIYAVDLNIIIDNLHSSESYKYLGFLQLKGVNHMLVKQSLINKFEARLKAVLKTSLNSGNKCKAINT